MVAPIMGIITCKDMNFLSRILQKIDRIAPDSWIIGDLEQTIPVTQLGFEIGMIVGLIISYFL